MKKKKIEDSPVFVLEETDLTVSDEANEGLKKFKETHTDMTPFMEELFIRAFDMCRGEYLVKMSNAVSKAKIEVADEWRNKLEKAQEELEESHQTSMKRVQTQLREERLDHEKQVKTITDRYYKYREEVQPLLELAKKEAVNNAQEIARLNNQISVLKVQHNTEVGVTGPSTIYEYTYEYNLKKSDFDNLFADGWEPKQLIVQDGDVCGVFQRPVTQAVMDLESEEIMNAGSEYEGEKDPGLLGRTITSKEEFASHIKYDAIKDSDTYYSRSY